MYVERLLQPLGEGRSGNLDPYTCHAVPTKESISDALTAVLQLDDPVLHIG